MMAERGVVISHSTILRWVQRYVPEFERRWSRYARGANNITRRMGLRTRWRRVSSRFFSRHKCGYTNRLMTSS